MLPTVAEVLALDPLRRGAPRVVAAADGLDAPVRWVHVIELAEAAHLLRGGELVLATGIALPDDPSGLTRYVADLASVGVSALAVELGSRYARSLPAALVSAASRHRLPLIVLERETQFIEVTEAVHALIIDAQLEELRASERLHQVFTDLAVSGAPAGEVVRQAAVLSGRPVILENLAHQVVACEATGQDTARLLAGFAARSRAVAPPGRTGYDPASGWLVTIVGARGEDWGRLIMARGSAPEPRDVALVERAATTLALGRLLDHQRESLERQAHRTILGAFLGHGYADPADAEARARALGVPVAGRRLLPVVVRLVSSGAGGSGATGRSGATARSGATGGSGAMGGSGGGAGLEAQARALQVADATAAACRAGRVPALVGSLDDTRVGALLALPPRADPDAVLGRLADRLRRRLGDDDVIGPARWWTRSPRCSARSSRRSRWRRWPRAMAAGSPSTGCRTCGCAACCTCSATTRGCRPLPSGSSARCCAATTPRAARCSPRSPPTWRPGATRRRRPSARTWRGRPCTSGCAGSRRCSASAWTPRSRAPRCTSPCWPRRPHGNRDRTWLNRVELPYVFNQ